MPITLGDLDITHFFVGPTYAKVTQLDAGMEVTQHVHRFDHDAVLLVGTCAVDVAGVRRTIEAPAVLTIKEGQAHKVTALTPALWVCLWDARGHTDPDRIDADVVAEAM